MQILACADLHVTASQQLPECVMTSEMCHTQEVQVIANRLRIPEWKVVKVSLCTEADDNEGLKRQGVVPEAS